ncbi:MAG: hypothetical protein WCA78_11980 [Rhizomicrobium sp.]
MKANVAEMKKRMSAALGGSDPQALPKGWMPLGGFEPFRKFLWDGAEHAPEPKKGQCTRR